MAAQFQPPYLRNPMGRAGTDFPTGTGTYAWNGATQTWSVLPSGSGTYGWSGTTQTWVKVEAGDGDGGGQMGVTDGSEAAPGKVGEFRQINGMAFVNATSGSPPSYQIVGTLSLTAGDWDISANVWVDDLAVSAPGGFWVWLGPAAFSTDGTQTDNSGPQDNVSWFGSYGGAALVGGGSLGPIRLLSSTSTGAQIRMEALGTGGQAQIQWGIVARRMR